MKNLFSNQNHIQYTFFFFEFCILKLVSQLAQKKLFFSGKPSCFQIEMEVTHQPNENDLYFLDHIIKLKSPKFGDGGVSFSYKCFNFILNVTFFGRLLEMKCIAGMKEKGSFGKVAGNTIHLLTPLKRLTRFATFWKEKKNYKKATKNNTVCPSFVQVC